MQALAVELRPGLSLFLGTKKKKEDGWNSTWVCVYARHSKPGLSPWEDPREALGHRSPRLFSPAGPSPLCPPSAKASSPLGTAWGLLFGARGPCPCVGVVSKPCSTAVYSQQSSEAALALPAPSWAPHAPLLGNLLGGQSFLIKGQISRVWEMCRLEKLMVQGEGELGGAGEITAPLLCGKNRHSQACPRAAGTLPPPRVPSLLGHPMNVPMVMSPGGVHPVRWGTGTPSSTARVTACPSSACTHLSTCPVPLAASRQSCSHGATKHESSY